MSDNIKILRNYLLYFLSLLLVCIVGISNVFADTIIDTASWVNVTGRQWSLGSQDYHIGDLTTDTNWVKNYFNVPSGYYTPPNSYDYVTFSFFQHYGDLNPCDGANYTASFKLKFSVPAFVNYVEHVQIVDNTCSIVSDSNTGIITATCPVTYSSSSNSYLSVYFNSISGNTSSDLFLSRNINFTCGLNTGAIIDNSTQNTQSIINNNNTNTENIINNQNQNTQEQIESQKVCNTVQVDINNTVSLGNLGTDGSVNSSQTDFKVSDFIPINSSSIIKVLVARPYGGSNLCFYTLNKTKLNCYSSANYSQNDIISIPNASAFVRFTISISSNVPVYEVKTCENGNQALNDSITGLNDSLNDDNSSGATSEASEFFSSFTTNTFGLTSIITAPLNLIQSLTSSSCSELHLPLPYLNNKYLDLPCMTSIYQTHFGAFFTMYQTITYGIIAYWVCVRIFNQVKDFKNPEHDEIEVVDL